MTRRDPGDGDKLSTIDPTEIPVFSGDLDAVAAAVGRFFAASSTVTDTGVRVHARFQGLSGCYHAPEAGELLSSTVSVRVRAGEFGQDLGAVGRALDRYVCDMRPIAARLDAVQLEADAFVVAQIPKGEDWDKDHDAVAHNNDLIEQVNSLVVAKADVERHCANVIGALVGGPNWQAAGSGTGPYQYGPAAIPENVVTPWGKATEWDKPWFLDVDDAARRFNKGFFVDGVWGTVKGLWVLSGAASYVAMCRALTGEGTWKEADRVTTDLHGAWKQLGRTAIGLAYMAGNPSSAAVLSGVEFVRPGSITGVDGFLARCGATAIGAMAGMVGYQYWHTDPARAAGLSTFSVASLFLPTKGLSGVGKAGAVGDAARTASAAEHAGEAAEGVARTGRAAEVGIRSLADTATVGRAGGVSRTVTTVADLRRVLGDAAGKGSQELRRLPDVHEPVSPGRSPRDPVALHPPHGPPTPHGLGDKAAAAGGRHLPDDLPPEPHSSGPHDNGVGHHPDHSGEPAVSEAQVAERIGDSKAQITHGTRSLATNADWTAYGRNKWAAIIEKLPSRVREAIVKYTGEPPFDFPSYGEINDGLRMHEKITPEIQKSIDRIDYALAAKPVDEPLVVMRGLNDSPGVFNRPIDEIAGTLQGDSAYMSTSLGETPAFGYKNVWLYLRIPEGTPAMYLGDISRAGSGERELLLGRGIDYWVDEVIFDPETGRHHVFGRVVR